MVPDEVLRRADTDVSLLQAVPHYVEAKEGEAMIDTLIRTVLGWAAMVLLACAALWFLFVWRP